MLRLERIERIAVVAAQIRMVSQDIVLAMFSKRVEAAHRDGNTGSVEMDELEICNLAITGPSLIAAQAAFRPDPVAGFEYLPWVFLKLEHAEAVAAFAHRVHEQADGSLVMLGLNYTWGMNVRIRPRN